MPLVVATFSAALMIFDVAKIRKIFHRLYQSVIFFKVV